MSDNRSSKMWAMGALLASALALGGCAISLSDLPGGTPSDAPARPKETGNFLPVHDLPPDRSEAQMAPAEQSKIQAELVAARDRQASIAAAEAAAAAAAAAKNPAAK